MKGRRYRIFLLITFLVMVSIELMAERSKIVIAHRGISAFYPENTMISFRRAIETSAECVELDVHLSADGIPVVIHDEDLSRTTTAKGKVGMYPASVLQRMSAGYSEKFGRKFYKEKIPLLTDALELILEKSDKCLLIEIKSHKEDLVYNRQVGGVVYDSMMGGHARYKDRIVFISFDQSILADIRKRDHEAKVAPIFFERPQGEGMASLAKKLGSNFVIFSKKLLNEEGIFEESERIKYFVYTVLPDEFGKMEKIRELYGFATDFANQISDRE